MRSTQCLALSTVLTAAALAETPATVTSRAARTAVPVVAPMVLPFPLQDVHLLDGPLKHSQDIAAAYLLSLEPDRLLARFRQEAGLKRKADNYPGWENKELPGVALSFYLSGCSRLYATLGDKRFQDRLTYCIDELTACQQANGNGYLLATRNGKKLFQEIASGDIRYGQGWILNGEAEPYYALEKLFSGLRDAWRHARNRQALEIEIRLADWLEHHMSALNDQQMDTLMQCEYGGMNWVLADLYADTGDNRYLALSRRWHDKKIEDPLAAGQDCLPGKHANTQFPKISGLASRFPCTGDLTDRVTAEFFWDRVVNHHSYVTGGNSESEHFGPPDRLSNRLTPSTTELCNSYNMIRLTQLLFAIEPRPEYVDYVERVLFNHVLAAQHPRDGRIAYFTPLLSGCPRTYQPLYDAFTCCTCSGLDSYAKHTEFIYMHDRDTLFVNLYAASEVYWREKGVRVRQETRFPDEDRARFTFTCDRPAEMTLALRCPAWAAEGVSISINGQLQPMSARRGGYAAIRQTWRSGNQVEIRLPMTLRIETMPDNAREVAFFAGPILLAAAVEAEDEEEDDDYVAQALVPDGQPLTRALVPVEGKPLEFAMTGIVRPRDTQLQPFFRLHDRPYAVYWDVMTEESWASKQKAHAERKQADAGAIDRVIVGSPTSESAHKMKGQDTHNGNGAYGKHMRRTWRDASGGGWFSYDVSVLPGHANQLCCAYWGREVGPRKFDVLVDGTVIATESLDGNHPEAFYDVVYPIPSVLIGKKSKVTVTLKAHANNTAGGLFGLQILKQ
jgi:uncharacterized protein